MVTKIARLVAKYEKKGYGRINGDDGRDYEPPVSGLATLATKRDVEMEYGLTEEILGMFQIWWAYGSATQLYKRQARRIQAYAALGEAFSVMGFSQCDDVEVNGSMGRSGLRLGVTKRIEDIITASDAPLTTEEKADLEVQSHLLKAVSLMDLLCVGPATFCIGKRALVDAIVDLYNQQQAVLLDTMPANSNSPERREKKILRRCGPDDFVLVNTAPPRSYEADLLGLKKEVRGKQALLIFRVVLDDLDRRYCRFADIVTLLARELVGFLGIADDESDPLAAVVPAVQRSIEKHRHENRSAVSAVVRAFLERSSVTTRNYHIVGTPEVADLEAELAGTSFHIRRHWTVIDELRCRAVQSPENKLIGIDAATTVIVDLLTTSPKQRQATLITAVSERNDLRRSIIIRAIQNPDDELFKPYLAGFTTHGRDEMVSIAAFRDSCFGYDEDEDYWEIRGFRDDDRLWAAEQSNLIESLVHCAKTGHTSLYDEEDYYDDEELPTTWLEVEDKVLDNFEPMDNMRSCASSDDEVSPDPDKIARERALASARRRFRNRNDDEWIPWTEAVIEYEVTADDLKGPYLAIVLGPAEQLGVWRSQALRTEAYSVLEGWGAPESIVNRVRRVSTARSFCCLTEMESLVCCRDKYAPLPDGEDVVYTRLQMLALKFQALGLMTIVFGGTRFAFCTGSEAFFEEFVAINNRRPRRSWYPPRPRCIRLVREDDDWEVRDVDSDDDDASSSTMDKKIMSVVLRAGENQELSDRTGRAHWIAMRLVEKRDTRRKTMATAFTEIGPNLRDLVGILSPECDRLMEALPRAWLVGFGDVERDRLAFKARVHEAVVAWVLESPRRSGSVYDLIAENDRPHVRGGVGPLCAQVAGAYHPRRPCFDINITSQTITSLLLDSKLQRAKALRTALRLVGLHLRDDSTFCAAYISCTTNSSLDEVVAVMKITNFLFEDGHAFWSLNHDDFEAALRKRANKGAASWLDAAQYVIKKKTLLGPAEPPERECWNCGGPYPCFACGRGF